MKFYAFCLFALAVFCVPRDAFGSHAMGTDLQYECLGNNQYRITVSFYRDCDGIPASPSLTLKYSSQSCGFSETTFSLNQISSQEVTPLCSQQLNQSTCNGGAVKGVELYTYSGVITLPSSCSDWLVSYQECCRNQAITNLYNADSYNLYAYATINNTNGLCDNSPSFTTPPVPYICAGMPYSYNQGAVDPDGDSLVYELIQPLHLDTVNVPYVGSFSPSKPLSTSGPFVFDPATGQMSFTPSINQTAVITVRVTSYRNGVIVGSTMRDIQVVMLSGLLCANLPPVVSTIRNMTGGSFIDSFSVQLCPGSTVSFDIPVTDANGDTIILTSNNQTAIPGSTFVVTGTGASVTARFTWTPSPTDVGFFPFQVTYKDKGCPVSAPQTITYVVRVFDKVSAGADQVFCGDSIQLHAVGGSYFVWTPAAGLSNPNVSNPLATPTVPTVYTVTSDCGSDAVSVDIQQSYNLNAGPDVSICLHALANLNAVATPESLGPYTFQWAPAVGLSSTTVPDPVASPPATTLYAVASTSAQGCIKRDTVRVAISGVAPNVTAFVSKDTVCPGEIVQLHLTTIPINCGVSAAPCSTTPLDYLAGRGTALTGSGTPYDGYWEDGRVQYLYRAAELNALGIAGGTISQLAFNIGDKKSTFPYAGFTIRMGCTSINELTSFVPGLTPVYGPVTYTSIAGWNTHVLSTPYDWDGVSNLVLEVCFNNATNIASDDDDVQYTTTSFKSVAFDFADSQDGGCTLPFATITRNRPNTRFSVCQQTITNATINWTPATYMVDAPTLQSPRTRVFGDTRFVGAVNAGGCTGQGYADVKVDTTIFIQAQGDTSLCLPTPVQLSSTSSGTPSPILLTCGVHNTVASAPVIYTLGTSTGLTQNPTPFKGTFHDGRMQMLIRQSELRAFGVERGVVNSIAFNVEYKNSTGTFRGFTIKMGCTTADGMTNNFSSGPSVVFGPKDVTTVPGWNTFTFDNTYDWDGLSNVLVEICYNNVGYVQDDIISFTATSYPSAVHAYADFSAGCVLTSATLTNSRPDMRFGISKPPLGTYTYAWSPGTGLNNPFTQNPISNTTATTQYVVSVTDGVCIATDTVDIRFYTEYDVNVFGSNIGCNGNSDGNAVSIPNGGVPPYNFIWGGGQTQNNALTDTLFNLAAGKYYVTVSDNNGCNADDSVTITVPPPLVVTATAQNVSCFGGSDGFAIAGGAGGTLPYRFLWSNMDTVAIAGPLGAGTYHVRLTDKSGCIALDTVAVGQPAALVNTMIENDVSCFRHTDGSATAQVSGGTAPYDYLWSNAQRNPTATSLVSGVYTITITDDSNCLLIDTAYITQPDSFAILVNPIDVSCFNGADGRASASVQGDTVNYAFRWNTAPVQNTPTATGLRAGTILLVVTDTTNCSINSSVTITQPNQIELASSAVDALCLGSADGRAEVHVLTGGTIPFTYLWSNTLPDSLITGLVADEYYVTVTDANNCQEFDTVTVAEPAAIAIQDSVVPVLCFGGNDGRIFATVSGGTPSFSFAWSNGDLTPIAGGLLAGTYTVTVTDNNGCIDSLTNIEVTEPAELFFGAIDATPSCPGNQTGIIVTSATGGISPYQFILDSTITQLSANFTALPAGVYSLRVTDANACFKDTSVTVIAFDSVHIAFDSTEIKLHLGESVTLTPVIQPANSLYSYSWQPSTGLSCNTCASPVATPLLTTPYELTIIDENGCPFTEQIVIEVDNELIVLVPNAFTPNGDGLNDFLNVYGISLKEIEFSVFNRWGQRIYYTNNPNDGWDGTYMGKAMPPDVYVYYVDAVFTDGQKKQIKGSTTILK